MIIDLWVGDQKIDLNGILQFPQKKAIQNVLEQSELLGSDWVI